MHQIQGLKAEILERLISEILKFSQISFWNYPNCETFTRHKSLSNLILFWLGKRHRCKIAKAKLSHNGKHTNKQAKGEQLKRNLHIWRNGNILLGNILIKMELLVPRGGEALTLRAIYLMCPKPAVLLCSQYNLTQSKLIR